MLLPPMYPESSAQPLFFNQERFRENLRNNVPIAVFKDAISGVNGHFEQRFLEGEDIRHLVTGRSQFIDLILHYAWHQYRWDDDIALIAVGGYGRGELHPHSDIDILVLLANNSPQKYNDQLQSYITFLWDIGLEVGSSVRTLDECIAIAKDDITVATNLMEARRITGNDRLRDELQILTGPEFMWPVSDFFRAKCEEQYRRHKKHNLTEYNLEPNIKNAPGGLRDLQTINWVAKRFFGVPTLKQLEGKDFFTEREYATLRSGEEFLWRVRYGVHMLAGRSDERLLFEHQRELAKIFCYEDSDKGLAVEQFMHKYYRTVLSVSELNDVLIQYLDESIHELFDRDKLRIINPRFQVRDNYIEVQHEKVFDETPSALLEIFVLMGNNPSIVGVRASTIRLIRERRGLIDDNFRQNQENNRMFMQIFSIKYGLVTQLTRMKRYGILGRYLPAFGKITGQMQFDLFHRYTVDAHTLLVIKNIRRFSLPEEEKQFPIAAHIVRQLPKPELLLIAGLFHDIGKGRGGDHSTLGAVDAIEFCRQHGLKEQDVRLVAWLVEHHLLMSYISQKQDTSDPDVILKFAQKVGDQTRLDYLYALTVADMCGTNPDIWNTWRASLMRQLYLETKKLLRRGLENPRDEDSIIEETQRQALLKLTDKDIDSHEARAIWKTLSPSYFVRENYIDIAWQTEAIAQHKMDGPLILVRETSTLAFEGATQIFIHAKKSKHFFGAVATCLARQRLNIQSARIYNAAGGNSLSTFYVLDENDQPLNNNTQRYTRTVTELHSALEEATSDTSIIERHIPRVLKQLSIPTETNITNTPENSETLLEVISPDRPGLLATIAKIFTKYNIHLKSAKITTLGERVEDVFFILDSHNGRITNPTLCEKLQQDICQELDSCVEAELNQ